MATLKSVARARGDTGETGLLKGIELSVSGMQKLLERAWDGGFGEGRHVDFGGKLLGKSGSAAWIGTVNMFEALCSLGVDALLLDVQA